MLQFFKYATKNSIDENKAEIVLGITLVTNDVNGKVMPPDCGKHIDGAAFQCGTCQLRFAAAFLECAYFAEVAWTGYHT